MREQGADLSDHLSGESWNWLETRHTLRLNQVSLLSQWYPGLQKPSDGDDLALWAGIYLQTRWQLDTNRVPLPHWSLPNAILTVFPYRIAVAQRQGENYCGSVPQFADRSLNQSYSRACQSWRQYFLAHEEGRARQGEVAMQKLMWRAHTASLDFMEQAGADRMGQNNIPLAEYRYWKGWLKFVVALDRSNFPTKYGVIRRLNDEFLAPCGPLGQGQCQPGNLPKTTQRMLAGYLMDENTSLNFLVGWVSKFLHPFT